MILLINTITLFIELKTKPIDVTGAYYAQYNENFNKKDPKFKVGDNVRISKNKNIFAEAYTPNWSEEGFVISKIKNTVKKKLMLLVTWMMKKLPEDFMKKN